MEYRISTLEQIRPLLLGFRQKSGLSQAQLAEKLGVSQQAYARIEANPAATSVERLFTILRLLGVSIALSDVKETPRAGMGAKPGPKEPW